MSKARVYLVGTGPGDPDLLTVKALRLLQNSDVVVYDRLVSDEILEQIPPGASRIYVGKRTGKHTLPQQEINALLVKLAASKRTIVRLKGGDPFVFGRGSEEAEYLARHQVPFEVIPGITSASACTTYAGIPLTHRGLAQGVQIITGHCRADLPLDLDWRSLADPSKTIVVYMGLANIALICDRLMQAGLAEETPAAAIQNGTTREQRRIISTLARLPRDTCEQGLTAPVLFVIGRVVRLAGVLDWFRPGEISTPNLLPVQNRGQHG
ncbi:MAG: uroporphyrinogen-III C-methyltransferase [Proteobacteria bacterium]|jgi:uroporphyrin-III C-methyltransferase/precorrin-2 dehydrogenase/sirohydrochlorin ferrochelatase/uroporphyrin-III C-methyltransferase|nr:uroporphyrinogen-III C-methyltransferase [Pseudomonadota bacterium]MCG6935179.1 uroporphyrinogen-III C-methyltransferase [Pseudomonadota bacterium]